MNVEAYLIYKIHCTSPPLCGNVKHCCINRIQNPLILTHMLLLLDITEPHPLSNTGGIGKKVGDVVLLIDSPEKK